MKVIDYLQTEVDPETFTPPAVYDGRRNLFAARELPLQILLMSRQSDQYSFTLGLPNPNTRRPPRVYDVTITKVASLNPQLLHEFVAGRQAVDNAITTTIQSLNIAIRNDVLKKYPTNSKSFFVSTGKRDIGGGVELWRGYFQSVRPAANRLLINVDVTTAMMFKEGPLIDVCLSFFEERDPRTLAPRHNFTPRRITALAKFLSNLSIRTTHNNRSRIIKSVSKAGARDLTFDFNGQRISIADYFRLEANRTLRFPDLVCVEVESGALIPLEVCIVPEGKLMKKELFRDKTKEMVEFSRMRPSDRFRDIRQGLDLLSFDQSPIVQHFGIRLTSSDPLSIPARVLPTPPLSYHTDSRPKTVRPSNGSWNMVDKKFYRPAIIRKWVVIIYEAQHKFNQVAVDRAIKDLVEAARARGMTVLMDRPVVKYCNGQGNIPDHFNQAGQECVAQAPEANKEGPGLFVVILPGVAGDIYTAIKHFGDIAKGVPTQCMQSFKCLKANNQYWNNILLKINPKLGGINNILDPNDRGSDFLKEQTIVLGADVMHPPPHTEGIPSYASVVGSVDSHAVKYVATTRAQKSKQEYIEPEDLESMCLHIFNKYKGYQAIVEKNDPRRAFPKRLLFFRDGVSEGEFVDFVKEIASKRDSPHSFTEACKAAKLNPKITYVVVGKRHHYRFCPQDPRDQNQADRSGNCPAGMVVDQVITHPIDFDYYLLSHGGLIGTSRAAHYSVRPFPSMVDPHADSLQALSFSLCHIFARATRSVSIPAPVYYAHLVCKRSKNHYDPRSGSDTASSSGGGSQGLRDRFKPLHDNQAGNMYFMVGQFLLTSFYMADLFWLGSEM
ncbi:Protein argonaute-3 [Leucoagaricus sp. SymC.cos]|nr:Protein argonaute-3 [Leucoagaricus sp. SymC.cos]